MADAVDLGTIFSDVELRKAKFDRASESVFKTFEALETASARLSTKLKSLEFNPDRLTFGARVAAESLTPLDEAVAKTMAGIERLNALKVDAKGITGDARGAAADMRAYQRAIDATSRSLERLNTVKVDLANSVQGMDTATTKLTTFGDEIKALRVEAATPIVQKIQVQRSGGSGTSVPAPSSGGFSGMLPKVQKAADVVATGSALITVGALGSADLAAKIDQMAQAVTGNTAMTAQQRDAMTKAVVKLMPTGTPPEQLFEAYMQAANRKYSGSMAATIMEVANKMGIAAHANVGTEGNVLAGNARAYNIPESKIDAFANMLHLGASQGSMTLEQFNNNSNKSMAFGAAKGLRPEEIVAAFSTITKVFKLPPNLVDTQLSGFINQITSPSAKSVKAALAIKQRTGFDLLPYMGVEGLKQHQLTGYVDALRQSGASTQEIANMFPGTRGQLPALGLAQAGYGTFQDLLNNPALGLRPAMTGAINPIASQYDDMQRQPGRQAAQEMGKTAAAAYEPGKRMEGDLADIIRLGGEASREVLKIVDAFSKLPQALREPIEQVGVLALMAKGLGLTGAIKIGKGEVGINSEKGILDAVKSGNLGKLLTGFKEVETAEGAVAAEGILSLGPSSLYVAALAGVAFAVYKIKTAWDDSRQAQSDYATKQKNLKAYVNTGDLRTNISHQSELNRSEAARQQGLLNALKANPHAIVVPRDTANGRYQDSVITAQIGGKSGYTQAQIDAIRAKQIAAFEANIAALKRDASALDRSSKSTTDLSNLRANLSAQIASAVKSEHDVKAEIASIQGQLKGYGTRGYQGGLTNARTYNNAEARLSALQSSLAQLELGRVTNVKALHATGSPVGDKIAQVAMGAHYKGSAEQFRHYCEQLVRLTVQAVTNKYDRYLHGDASTAMHNFQRAGIGYAYQGGPLNPGDLAYSDHWGKKKLPHGHAMTVGPSGQIIDNVGAGLVSPSARTIEWIVPMGGKRSGSGGGSSPSDITEAANLGVHLTSHKSTAEIAAEKLARQRASAELKDSKIGLGSTDKQRLDLKDKFSKGIITQSDYHASLEKLRLIDAASAKKHAAALEKEHQRLVNSASKANTALTQLYSTLEGKKIDTKAPDARTQVVNAAEAARLADIAKAQGIIGPGPLPRRVYDDAEAKKERTIKAFDDRQAQAAARARARELNALGTLSVQVASETAAANRHAWKDSEDSMQGYFDSLREQAKARVVKLENDASNTIKDPHKLAEALMSLDNQEKGGGLLQTLLNDIDLQQTDAGKKLKLSSIRDQFDEARQTFSDQSAVSDEYDLPGAAPDKAAYIQQLKALQMQIPQGVPGAQSLSLNISTTIQALAASIAKDAKTAEAKFHRAAEDFMGDVADAGTHGIEAALHDMMHTKTRHNAGRDLRDSLGKGIEDAAVKTIMDHAIKPNLESAGRHLTDFFGNLFGIKKPKDQEVQTITTDKLIVGTDTNANGAPGATTNSGGLGNVGAVIEGASGLLSGKAKTATGGIGEVMAALSKVKGAGLGSDPGMGGGINQNAAIANLGLQALGNTGLASVAGPAMALLGKGGLSALFGAKGAIGGLFAKGGLFTNGGALGGVGAALPWIGGGLALNSILGNPLKKIGKIFGLASGGVVPGIGFHDSVPAMLTPGERVLTRGQNASFERGGMGRGNATYQFIHHGDNHDAGDVQQMFQNFAWAVHHGQSVSGPGV